MNKDDIKYLKKKLEAEKKILEGELGEISIKKSDGGPWIPAPPQDDVNITEPEDMAHKEESFIDRQAITSELSARLFNVKLALQKIKEGKYGLCEISGEEIERDRLEANPAARTCKAHREHNI
ncbi:MAG: TraR/DksA C4-type zinc finger protein [Candidatus Campbellbacteria bacterium]|nr:TraR/DksA C4-type zinc finger protein [Candidatus Campbellbacteria bacterium]